MVDSIRRNEVYCERVAAVEGQFAEIQVQDELRRSKKLSMPSHELSGQFDLLVSDMMNCGKLGSKGQQKKMMACFGTLPMVAAKIWELIDEEGCTNDKHLKGKPVTSKAKPQHLLYALLFLRTYETLSCMGAFLKVQKDKKEPDENTISKWIWVFIEAMYSILRTFSPKPAAGVAFLAYTTVDLRLLLILTRLFFKYSIYALRASCVIQFPNLCG